MSDPTQTGGQKPTRKHGPARRKLLKSLALGGGAAAAATAVPKQWVKPIVDVLEVPLHAQASFAGSMSCELTVSHGDVDEVFSEGVHFAANGLSGDDADIDAEVFIDPPVGGVSVDLTIVPIGDSPNDASVDPGDQSGVTDADGAGGDAGQVDFGSNYSYTLDGPASDGSQGFTATFSAPGYPDCVITVSFPNLV